MQAINRGKMLTFAVLAFTIWFHGGLHNTRQVRRASHVAAMASRDTACMMLCPTPTRLDGARDVEKTGPASINMLDYAEHGRLGCTQVLYIGLHGSYVSPNPYILTGPALRESCQAAGTPTHI